MSHSGENRAEYSVVVIGADPARSIELSFWIGNIRVPDPDATDPDRFVHGADVAFDTTAASRNYRLSQPDLVCFGDDSSRGMSVSELGQVMLTLAPVPEPASSLLWVAGIAALAWRCRGLAG